MLLASLLLLCPIVNQNGIALFSCQIGSDVLCVKKKKTREK
jgi:hypothetical protein